MVHTKKCCQVLMHLHFLFIHYIKISLYNVPEASTWHPMMHIGGRNNFCIVTYQLISSQIFLQENFHIYLFVFVFVCIYTYVILHDCGSQKTNFLNWFYLFCHEIELVSSGLVANTFTWWATSPPTYIIICIC